MEATSSTSVNITWSPPLPENQNGIITNYTVNITDLDNGGYDITVTPNNTLFVSSLQPHTAYEIVIYASTSGGDGPATIPFAVQTHEDGTFGMCTLQGILDFFLTCTNFLTLQHPHMVPLT